MLCTYAHKPSKKSPDLPMTLKAICAGGGLFCMACMIVSQAIRHLTMLAPSFVKNIKMSKVWSLSVEFCDAWQEVAMHRRTPYLPLIFIKSMVSLKMSILLIWVTWASKITFKKLQLCSIKIKGSYAPVMSHAAALLQWNPA